MPLMVRNTLTGPTVMTKKDKWDIRWEATNDPMGGDVQRIPDEMVNDVDFLKAIDSGIFVVEEAEDVVRNAIAAQSAAVAQRREAMAVQTAQTIERTTSNDIVQVPCVGPNPRGHDGECGNPVAVRDRNRNDKPPLCTAHEGLARQFIPVEDMNAPIVNGKKVIRWARTSTGDALPSQ